MKGCRAITPTAFQHNPAFGSKAMPEFDSTIEYRDVQGFPGYKVGNDGSVWSCKRFGRWKRMSASKSKGLYYVLSLYRCGKKYLRKVHHLLLETFVSPRIPGLVCRHLNGDSLDNSLENLCWGTSLENSADTIRQGRSPKGEKSHTAKLSERDIAAILVSPETAAKMAQRFHVSIQNVNCIRQGITWKHVPRQNYRKLAAD